MPTVKHKSSGYLRDSQASASVLQVLALAVGGALGRIRTDDQELSRDPLYPLSYEREGG